MILLFKKDRKVVGKIFLIGMDYSLFFIYIINNRINDGNVDKKNQRPCINSS